MFLPQKPFCLAFVKEEVCLPPLLQKLLCFMIALAQIAGVIALFPLSSSITAVRLPFILRRCYLSSNRKHNDTYTCKSESKCHHSYYFSSVGKSAFMRIAYLHVSTQFHKMTAQSETQV